jgi:hypothetical protein
VEQNINIDTTSETSRVREELTELLKGGFAPLVILLREFHYDKAGIVLPGLPFSAWSLLKHMTHRQTILLEFMREPQKYPDVWPDAYWPPSPLPESEFEWVNVIHLFEKDLEEMINIVNDSQRDLTAIHENGKTLSWAAMTCLHHNAYTIGQIKIVGRQLGVW